MSETPPNHIALYPVIEGGSQAARFRYSREGFRRNLAIALGLTGLVCGLVWLLLGINGSPHMTLYTLITGFVFFAFISARTLTQYFRNEVVLAVQPTGLYDARISSETIPWDAIKELVLSRAEQDYSLSIVLWPKHAMGAGRMHFDIELTALESGSEPVLNAISQYRQIRLER
jgi:hypothetical protein